LISLLAPQPIVWFKTGPSVSIPPALLQCFTLLRSHQVFLADLKALSPTPATQTPPRPENQRPLHEKTNNVLHERINSDRFNVPPPTPEKKPGEAPKKRSKMALHLTHIFIWMARAKEHLSKWLVVCSRGAHYVEQKLAGIAWVASSGSVWRRK